MKIKFEIEIDMHEKLVYSLNTKRGEDKISQHDKDIVHGRIEKVMSVLEDNMADLPFNESRIFVQGKCKSGCIIYVPVARVYQDAKSQSKYEKQCKDFLQSRLDLQPAPNVYNFPPRTPWTA